MTKFIALIAAAAGLFAVTAPEAQAQCGSRRIVAYDECGHPIYQVRVIGGYDRCGQPYYVWRNECSAPVYVPRCPTPRYDSYSDYDRSDYGHGHGHSGVSIRVPGFSFSTSRCRH
jgi:hypothetical protein